MSDVKKLIHSLLILSLILPASAFPSQSTAPETDTRIEETQVPAFTAADLSGLSFNRLQILRNSYLDFMEQQNENFSKVHEHASFFSFISTAVALRGDGDTCFFGGWLSTIKNGSCAIPDEAKSGCEGSSGAIECNPALFPGKDNQALCMPASNGFRNLTSQCAENSKDQISNIKNSPANLERLSAISQKIKNFCDANPHYDACGTLSDRIAAATGKDKLGNYTADGMPSGRSRRPAGKATSAQPTEGTEAAVNPNSANEVLSQCKTMIKNEGLNGEGVSSCAASPNGGALNSKADFQNLATGIATINYANDAVAKGLEQTLLSLVATELQFRPGKDIDTSSANALVDYLSKNYPNLAGNPSFSKTVKDVYKQIKTAQQKGKLGAVDSGQAASEFNQASKKVKAACDDVHAKYVAKYGEAGFTTRNWNRFIHDGKDKSDFLQQSKQEMAQAIDEMQRSSRGSALMGSSFFQKNVFDPTVDLARACAQQQNYVPVKTTLEAKEIDAGAQGTIDNLKESLRKLAVNESTIKSNDPSKARDVLSDFLKNDPDLLKASMYSKNPNDQRSSSAIFCTLYEEKLKSDRNWKWVKWTLAGVGTVAGVVLIASGLGAPIGVGLLSLANTAIVGTAAVDVAMGGNAVYQAHQANKNIQQQISSNLGAGQVDGHNQNSSLSTNVDRQKQAHDDKVAGGIQAGMGALGVVGTAGTVVKDAKFLMAGKEMVFIGDAGKAAESGVGLTSLKPLAEARLGSSAEAGFSEAYQAGALDGKFITYVAKDGESITAKVIGYGLDGKSLEVMTKTGKLSIAGKEIQTARLDATIADSVKTGIEGAQAGRSVATHGVQAIGEVPPTEVTLLKRIFGRQNRNLIPEVAFDTPGGKSILGKITSLSGDGKSLIVEGADGNLYQIERAAAKGLNDQAKRTLFTLAEKPAAPALAAASEATDFAPKKMALPESTSVSPDNFVHSLTNSGNQVTDANRFISVKGEALRVTGFTKDGTGVIVQDTNGGFSTLTGDVLSGAKVDASLAQKFHGGTIEVATEANPVLVADTREMGRFGNAKDYVSQKMPGNEVSFKKGDQVIKGSPEGFAADGKTMYVKSGNTLYEVHPSALVDNAANKKFVQQFGAKGAEALGSKSNKIPNTIAEAPSASRPDLSELAPKKLAFPESTSVSPDSFVNTLKASGNQITDSNRFISVKGESMRVTGFTKDGTGVFVQSTDGSFSTLTGDALAGAKIDATAAQKFAGGTVDVVSEAEPVLVADTRAASGRLTSARETASQKLPGNEVSFKNGDQVVKGTPEGFAADGKSIYVKSGDTLYEVHPSALVDNSANRKFIQKFTPENVRQNAPQFNKGQSIPAPKIAAKPDLSSYEITELAPKNLAMPESTSVNPDNFVHSLKSSGNQLTDSNRFISVKGEALRVTGFTKDGKGIFVQNTNGGFSTLSGDTLAAAKIDSAAAQKFAGGSVQVVTEVNPVLVADTAEMGRLAKTRDYLVRKISRNEVRFKNGDKVVKGSPEGFAADGKSIYVKSGDTLYEVHPSALVDNSANRKFLQDFTPDVYAPKKINFPEDSSISPDRFVQSFKNAGNQITDQNRFITVKGEPAVVVGLTKNGEGIIYQTANGIDVAEGNALAAVKLNSTPAQSFTKVASVTEADPVLSLGAADKSSVLARASNYAKGKLSGDLVSFKNGDKVVQGRLQGFADDGKSLLINSGNELFEVHPSALTKGSGKKLLKNYVQDTQFPRRSVAQAAEEPKVVTPAAETSVPADVAPPTEKSVPANPAAPKRKLTAAEFQKYLQNVEEGKDPTKLRGYGLSDDERVSRAEQDLRDAGLLKGELTPAARTAIRDHLNAPGTPQTDYYQHTPAELRAKMVGAKDAGIDSKQADFLIRNGYAGESRDMGVSKSIESLDAKVTKDASMQNVQVLYTQKDGTAVTAKGNFWRGKKDELMFTPYSGPDINFSAGENTMNAARKMNIASPVSYDAATKSQSVIASVVEGIPEGDKITLSFKPGIKATLTKIESFGPRKSEVELRQIGGEYTVNRREGSKIFLRLQTGWEIVVDTADPNNILKNIATAQTKPGQRLESTIFR